MRQRGPLRARSRDAAEEKCSRNGAARELARFSERNFSPPHYEKVIAGHCNPLPFLRNESREHLRAATGATKLPALKLPDGTIVTHSRAILAWIDTQTCRPRSGPRAASASHRSAADVTALPTLFTATRTPDATPPN